jgi:PAS domain S-box-containing protein
MKEKTKILVGFSCIIVFVIIQTVSTYVMQNVVMAKDNQLKNVEAPLEVMAERSKSYGTMLIEEVHGALLHALQGEYVDVADHKIVYDKLVLLENNLHRDFRIILNQSNIPSETRLNIEQQLRIIDDLSPKMIELEQTGFTEIEKKELKTANAILIGGNHKIYKAELFQAYDDLIGIQHELTLSVSNSVLKTSQQIININLGISIGVMTMIIIIMFVLRSFIEERYKKYKQFGEYLDNIINSVADPIFVKDNDYRFITANNALCEMLGISRENIIGKTLGESLPEDQMKHFLKIDKEVLESGEENISKEKLTSKGGKILTIITKKTRYIDEKGSKFLVGIIRDITDNNEYDESKKNNI